LYLDESTVEALVGALLLMKLKPDNKKSDVEAIIF
jgi:hypothetical protein